MFPLVVVFADDVFVVDTWVLRGAGAALGIGAILGAPFVAGRGESSIARRWSPGPSC